MIIISKAKRAVTSTIKLDLLDLQPHKMAFNYVDGHLIVQIQCNPEEANAIIEDFSAVNKFDDRMKHMERQIQELTEQGAILKEVAAKRIRKPDKIKQAEPEINYIN